MRLLGQTAKTIRSRLSLTQEEMAEELDISVVHLSNIENDKAMPSAALMSKYNGLSGVDMYVLDWCSAPDVTKLPKPVRDAAIRLRDLWSQVE